MDREIESLPALDDDTWTTKAGLFACIACNPEAIASGGDSAGDCTLATKVM